MITGSSIEYYVIEWWGGVWCIGWVVQWYNDIMADIKWYNNDIIVIWIHTKHFFITLKCYCTKQIIQNITLSCVLSHNLAKTVHQKICLYK